MKKKNKTKKIVIDEKDILNICNELADIYKHQITNNDIPLVTEETALMFIELNRALIIDKKIFNEQ